jgi:hypothetical protein
MKAGRKFYAPRIKQAGLGSRTKLGYADKARQSYAGSPIQY